MQIDIMNECQDDYGTVLVLDEVEVNNYDLVTVLQNLAEAGATFAMVEGRHDFETFVHMNVTVLSKSKHAMFFGEEKHSVFPRMIHSVVADAIDNRIFFVFDKSGNGRTWSLFKHWDDDERMSQIEGGSCISFDEYKALVPEEMSDHLAYVMEEFC